MQAGKSQHLSSGATCALPKLDEDSTTLFSAEPDQSGYRHCSARVHKKAISWVVQSYWGNSTHKDTRGRRTATLSTHSQGRRVHNIRHGRMERKTLSACQRWLRCKNGRHHQNLYILLCFMCCGWNKNYEQSVVPPLAICECVQTFYGSMCRVISSRLHLKNKLRSSAMLTGLVIYFPFGFLMGKFEVSETDDQGIIWDGVCDPWGR